jgi:hypothetical protein
MYGPFLGFIVYLVLFLICSALAISSLISNTGTNAAVALNKMKSSEGFYGFILVLSSILILVLSIKAMAHLGGFAIVQAVFALIMSLVGIVIGVLLGFTLFMKAGTSMPEPPAMGAGNAAPPPMPGMPATMPGAGAAAALNMIRVPLGFAGLGIALLNFIFSFF